MTWIIDAGAHGGLFSVMALVRAPSARIIAIEANIHLHPIREANLSRPNQWDFLDGDPEHLLQMLPEQSGRATIAQHRQLRCRPLLPAHRHGSLGKLW
jgi:FkbM family methyltransferase